jgi:nicotinate phosphoribosyltransferase
MIINSLLDTDLYKLTMQQVVFHKFPEADVEYAFKCRNAGVDLTPFAGEIRREIEHLCKLRITEAETDYLRGIRYMQASYVDSLQRLTLNPACVEISTENGFELTIRGNWYQTILFEVPVLAIVNEVYFRHQAHDGVNLTTEGLRRLHAKCDLIEKSRVKPFFLIEFGTRRRYSREWQARVVSTLRERIPDSLLGTSNVGLAYMNGLRPIGTMAHEFLQACQAYAPLPDFQKYAFEAWMQAYRGDLGIALSDVVGTNAFFNDFDRLFSKAYDGARHDSGDPVEWGERLVAHYQKFNIDPTSKFAVFSDSLDVPKALELARHFQGRIGTNFGIGTNLTNDLGLKPLNIVIKMTMCNGRPVAKLSDSPGKTMCEDEVYLDYLRQVFR